MATFRKNSNPCINGFIINGELRKYAVWINNACKKALSEGTPMNDKIDVTKEACWNNWVDYLGETGRINLRNELRMYDLIKDCFAA